MAYPGGPRPGTGPPNYNPNSLSESMQNLNVNRPSGPRPPPQQFPGQSPMVRPGPPPPGVRPTFPPSGTQMPPSIAPNRPSGPSPPFGSRPSPPGPYSQGNSPVARPNTSPFGSSPMTRVPGPGPISNGPPMAPQGAPRFPSTGNFPPQQGQMPFSNRGPSPPPPMGMRPVVGSMPTASPRGQVQPPQFSAPPQGMPPASGSSPFFAGRPPPMGSSPFGAPPQGGAPPVGSPYAPPPWQMQQGQRSEQLYFELTDARDKLLSRDQNAAVVNVFQLGVDISMVPPPPSVPGAMQPPRMFGMQPPNQSMSSGMGGSPSKVDPNQIPRPIPSNPVILHETRQGNQANPPPPATSSYIVKDTGNCSPRYMRCTINQVPCTVEILTTSGMQLALMVQPLAMPHPSEESIQVVDFGESGPVRCSRCKGYINPFMKFIDQGKRFICNFCGSTEETPREYHCNLGPDGRRRDADERAELCRGTVEFVATKEYMVRDPMPAVYFFLIDVSLNAIQTGATAAACSAINQVIADLPEGPRTMVGVATYDSTIHFYNMKRALQQPLMLIVPDIQDVYTPLESDVIVQLSECRQHLELLLECIPSMFQSNKTADSAFGAAVKAAFLALKSTGGKLLVFQTVLPSVGLGALSAREAEGRTNVSFAEKEANKLLQPVDKTLNTMATELAEYQVCVDIFVTAQSYVDIASLSVIPRTTGGQVYYYHPFSAISDSAKLFNDLKWNVTRPQGFEAVMRVRCSQGIQVQDYSGNFCKRIPTDVDLPAIDCDKTIMVTMKHDDKLQDGSECAFQCALLYTTVYGERRIRVSTLSLPCTSLISNLFRSADLDTQFACFLKQAANEIPTSPLSQVRDKVTNLCIAVLFSYRKFCATVSSAGQLILPEALKLLPLYTLALVKSVGLRHDGRIDDRSFWINYVSFLSTPLAIPLVYPRMMAIHDLDVKEMDGSLPPVIPLSSEHISDSGIYLLENGDDCLIYIGNTVDPSILQRLFGISSVDEVPTQFVLQQYDNPLSKKLNDVVNEIRRQRCSYLRLKLCKKGDPSGMMFLSYMVEDKTITGHSYVEFLVHVHRQIQNKMSV